MAESCVDPLLNNLYLRKKALISQNTWIENTIFQCPSPTCFFCCVTTHNEKSPLVRVSAQTGICAMERHAPVVFPKLSCANSIHRAAAQEDDAPIQMMIRHVGGRPKTCTFPSDSRTTCKGLLNFLSSHVLSRGMSFSPRLPLLEFLPGWSGGVRRGFKEVPERQCYCFRSYRWHAS